MRKILLVLLVTLLFLVACSSGPEYPDYSTPERSLESLRYAASQQDAFGVYDVFATAFKEEQGVSYELFAASMEVNPGEYERMANVEIAQVYPDEDVVVILLEDGDRMFFVNEQGLWKVRMIAPAPQP